MRPADAVRGRAWPHAPGSSRARLARHVAARMPGRTEAGSYERARGRAAAEFGQRVADVGRADRSARGVVRAVRAAMPATWRVDSSTMGRAARRVAYLAALARTADNLGLFGPGIPPPAACGMGPGARRMYAAERNRPA